MDLQKPAGAAGGPSAFGVTDLTVRRDWVKARAWLHAELAAGASADA